MILKKGFTLIELVVVISIISLLSSIMLSSISTARSKSRDARRAADIAQIRKAIELYYDANGRYPSTGGATAPNNAWASSNDSSWTTLQTALAPYITSLPHDPRETASANATTWAGNAGNYTYSIYVDGGYYCPQARQWYMIVYRKEMGGSGPGMTEPCPGQANDGGPWNWGGGAITNGTSAI